MLLDNYSGNYQIFDINGVLVQQAKFDNQTELQIEMSQNLKSGVYVLKVITDTNIFTGKIILNK
jgi:methionine-rich copper-binding protein CopC